MIFKSNFFNILKWFTTLVIPIVDFLILMALILMEEDVAFLTLESPMPEDVAELLTDFPTTVSIDPFTKPKLSFVSY
jgi:hypothetical protein